MNELQAEYNKVLARVIKAEKYLDGDAPDEEKEKWIPEFMKLLARLRELMREG
jgi:hypothetical protein